MRKIVLVIILFFISINFLNASYYSDNKVFCDLVNGSSLVGEDGEFLGYLSTNKYDSDSISYRYGTYGGKYNSSSIFNRYGTYGSKYNSYSPWNKYSSEGPLIINGSDYLGRLSLNKYDSESVDSFGVLLCIIDSEDDRLEPFWDLYEDKIDTYNLYDDTVVDICGENSFLNYDSDCECKLGYAWEDYDDSKNLNCIKKEEDFSFNTTVINTCGENSYLNNDSKCYCADGYIWKDSDSTSNFDCVVKNVCSDTINGYLGTDNKCYCNEGFIWGINTNKCIKEVIETPTQVCNNEYGIYSYGDGTFGDNGGYNCYCEEGYMWSKNMSYCELANIEDELQNKYKIEFEKKFGYQLRTYSQEILEALILKIDSYLEKDINVDTQAKLKAFKELVKESL